MNITREQMNNQFSIGDIIVHKEPNRENTYNDNRYYYIVLHTFNRYTIEYYKLFCFVGQKEVTLRRDNAKHYRIVSKA